MESIILSEFGSADSAKLKSALVPETTPQLMRAVDSSGGATDGEDHPEE